MHGRRWVPRLAGVGVLVAVAVLPPAAATGTARGPSGEEARLGAFSAPFREPGPVCEDHHSDDPEHDGPKCNPAAVTVVVLPNGRVLYWDGLEGTERVEDLTAAEIGDAAGNDQSRVLDLRGRRPAFSKPRPAIGGPSDGYPEEYLFPGAPPPLDQALNDPSGGDVALFCANQVLLANGDVMAGGGTNWYAEPRVPGTKYGLPELAGIRDTRVFRTATGRWTRVGPMRWARWYPAFVTLPDSKVFMAGGVSKLIKPLYPDRPPAESGTNVVQTETFDPRTGKWRFNGESANRSLPLYARVHLLPNGKVFYDPGGQAFNPAGWGYDEALWNISAVYDPRTRVWTDGPIPGLGTAAPGFRGSTFSVMLPLKPPYTQAQFLAAGGVIGTPPGGYFAVADSRIATVDTTNEDDGISYEPAGPLNNARWFSSAVVLPTGQVMTFSGATRDEVVGPGTGNPVRQAELFDPETKEWTPMAAAGEDRAYHNTAVLLPDGRVLVGGHAPIPALYTSHRTLPGGFTDNHRNTTFEIYSPPYLFWGPRPVIAAAPSALRHGASYTLRVAKASSIGSVVLVRNTATTHLIDGDQRSVELRIVRRTGDSVTIAVPPAAVVPPGPYLLFVNAKSNRGLIPSVGRQVFVGP